MNRNLTLSLFASLGLGITGCPSDDPAPSADASSEGSETSTTTSTTTETTVADTDTDTDTDESSSSTTAAPPTGNVRVVHASPTAGLLDVFVAEYDQELRTDLAFTDVTERWDFQALDEAYALEFRLPGSDEPIAVSEPFTIEEGDLVTVIVIGNLDDETDPFTVLLFDQDDFGEIEQDAVGAIAVHGVPSAPSPFALDFGADASAEITDFAFGQTGDATLAAENGLQVGLSVLESDRSTAFTIDAEDFAGEGVFVIPTGLTASQPRDETGLGLLVVGPEGGTFVRQNPTVYLFYTSFNVFPVDVCAGSTEVVANAEYGTFSSFQRPPGTFALEFVLGGATNCDPGFLRFPFANSEAIEVEAGERYLIVASGGNEDAVSPLQLLVVPEAFEPSKLGVVAHAIHAAGAPTVDIGLLIPDEPFNRLFDQFAYGSYRPIEVPIPDADPIPVLPPGIYPIGVIPDPDDTNPEAPVLGPFVIGIGNDGGQLTLAPTARGWLIAHGSTAEAAANPFTISFVDTTPNATLDVWTRIPSVTIE